MHNPLFSSRLGQWLNQAITKPADTTRSTEVNSISAGSDIDCVLVHAFSLGSEPAFRRIYDRYAPGIYRVSLRYFQSGQVAEDLVSEVFTALWHKRTKFSEPDEVKLFLFTKSKGVAIKYLISMKNRKSSL